MSHTSLDCPHCATADCGSKITFGGRLPEEAGEARYYFVAVCQRCGAPTMIVARQVTRRVGEGAALVRHVCRTHRDPIPNFIEPLRFIPERSTRHDVPSGLPESVASAYRDALECQSRGFAALAAMGYRCTLERASRALGGNPQRPLVARLSTIAASSGLHPDFVAWAGRVSLLQTETAAPETDPTAAEIAELASLTEMLLTSAFSVPHRIESHCKPAAVEAPEPAKLASSSSTVTTLPVHGRAGAAVDVRKFARAF